MLTSSQKVFQSYTELMGASDTKSYIVDFSTFLLSLDLNGQGDLATHVWEEVTLEYLIRGEGKAWEKLRGFQATIFGSPS